MMEIDAMKMPYLVTLPFLLAICPANAATGQDNSAGDLTLFEGMWQVSPRGAGPGAGPPPDAGQGNRFGPSPGALRRDGRRGPPAAGPEGDASDLPGPDIEGLDRGDRMTWSIMTPAGKAAFESMNPRDLPSNNCRSNGLPSLVGIPDLQEWNVTGNVLTVHYADFNTVRTIYLDGRADTDGPSHLGHSTGEWQGSDFVVTTTGLVATPGGLGRNAPGSASRSYIERYHLNADGSVGGTVTITDPDYLSRELTIPIALTRAEAGAEIPDVGCSVEASQRYLD